MMNYVWGALVVLSVISGLFNGRMAEVSGATLKESLSAVELCIRVLGATCLWSGIMRIASKSGLTQKLSKLFAPLFRHLFKDLKEGGEAMQAICMNFIANLLGLGNAATPMGIRAMAEMEKEAGYPKRATNSMVTFVVMNTASLQLIPTTVAMLRLGAGSQAPFEILPAVWAVSLLSVVAAVGTAKLFGGRAGKSSG